MITTPRKKNQRRLASCAALLSATLLAATPLASPAAIAESDSTLLSTTDGTDTTGSTVPGSSDPIPTEDLTAGEHIKQATGAEKIDLVGHSQGALITKIYMQQMNGAANVRRVVSMSGSFHGTDFNGLGQAARFLIDAMPPIMEFFLSKASTQQIIGSPLINELNKLPDTTAGVTYTALYTPIDDTVTPNSSSQLTAVPGADVANINTSLACPDSPAVEHATMPQNAVTIGLTLWGLERAEGDHTPAPGAHCTR